MNDIIQHTTDQDISDTTEPEMTTGARLIELARLLKTEPRAVVAWKINDLGMALARLSTRIHDECPSSFDEFWSDGFAFGRRYSARATRRELVERFEELGLPSDDETMARLGFAPKVVAS